MENVLESRNLTKVYDKRITALNHISLVLPKGKIIGLLGPNGSGKSTFIKLACGLLTPTEGEVFINGKRPGPETKARVSYLPEKDALPAWMKVGEALDFFEDFYADFERARALAMLEQLQISPAAHLKTLSKGTHEKVQLILAMSRAADLYLLDEPIGGVDPAARDYILNTIIANYREDATVIISTHLIADIEKILDEVVFLGYGQVSMQATVDEIRTNHGKSVDGLFREVFRC